MKKVLLLFLAFFTVFGLAACDLAPDDVEDILDCLETPEDPDCQVDGLLVDQIVAEWDGSLEHVRLVFDDMDFSEAMTQTTTIDIEIVEGTEVISVQAVTVDSFVFGEYNKVHREMTNSVNIMGETVDFTTELIYVEVETGVHVYFNTGSIRDLLNEQGLQEVTQSMGDLGLPEDWVVFKFDDSLTNVIEVEVLKNMLREVLWQEIGPTFFYDVQDELELELGMDLNTYGIDLGLFVDYVLNEQFDQAQAMVDGINFDLLLNDFDVVFAADLVAAELTNQQAQILIDLPGYDFAAQQTYLETNGAYDWFIQLTPEEQTYFRTLLNDQGIIDLYINIHEGTLPHYLVMMFLAEAEMDLMEIPGLDYAQLEANLDALDYDALMLESIDVVLLLEAILAGQTEFDAFVLGLQTTAPQTAAILAPFSGSMVYLDDLRMLIDDIELGFDNLTMFEEYFTLEYYIQGNMATLDVEANENNEVVTTMTIDNYGTLFNDVVNDVYWYLDQFQTFEMPYVDPINCPAGEYCEMLPLDEIEGVLNAFGPIETQMVYDPLNPDYMIMEIELSGVVNEYIEGMTGEASPLQNATITIEMEEGGDVVMPTAYSDVNAALEDFAKFSIYFHIWDIMDDIEWEMVEYEGYAELVGATTAFADTDIYLSPAFDYELSTITVGGTLEAPEISVDLYWVDETRVFTMPITLAELQPVIGNGSGAPDAVEYATYLGKVDPANYATTKLILMYLLHDDYEDDYYYSYDESYIYYDALMVESAAEYFCLDNACDPYMQLTYGDLMPYMGWLDEDYYELYDYNITIVDIVDGNIYVTLEPWGQGNLEFPDWITPSLADESYVQEDWD